MNKHQMRLGIAAAVLCLVSAVIAEEVYAQSLNDVLGVRSSTSVDGAKSQAKIDQLSEDTQDLLAVYKRVIKIVEELRIYNEQQRRQIKKQEQRLVQLDKSIVDATV
ncbi:MAG: DUF3450 family protein, partial [Pseudomonadales bacterium]